MSDVEQAYAVPIEEQAERLREHYEKAADALGEWHNQIPVAIDEWEAKRLRERTGTGEGAPVAWEVRHGKYVGLWTARRKDSAIRQVESLREAYPDDEVTLRPLGYLRHQPTDEGREG